MTTAASRFTPDQLFDQLAGREFEGFAAFQQAVLDVFNRHVRELPTGYTYVDAIDWGIRRRRVHKGEGRTIIVEGVS